MDLIAWEDRYSVKVPQFDTDHKQLVSMVNQLHNAMAVGKGREEVGVILERLINYTKRHFAAEEELMRKTGYPRTEEHTIEHQRLCITVDEYAKQFAAGSMITMSVMQFLKDWLLNHILKTDMLYSEHLREHGVAA
jgi:hemerythrin